MRLSPPVSSPGASLPSLSGVPTGAAGGLEEHLQGREELFAVCWEDGADVGSFPERPGRRAQAGGRAVPLGPGPRLCGLPTCRPGLGTKHLQGWWQQGPQDMAMSPTVHPVAI